MGLHAPRVTILAVGFRGRHHPQPGVGLLINPFPARDQGCAGHEVHWKHVSSANQYCDDKHGMLLIRRHNMNWSSIDLAIRPIHGRFSSNLVPWKALTGLIGIICTSVIVCLCEGVRIQSFMYWPVIAVELDIPLDCRDPGSW